MNPIKRLIGFILKKEYVDLSMLPNFISMDNRISLFFSKQDSEKETEIDYAEVRKRMKEIGIEIDTDIDIIDYSATKDKIIIYFDGGFTIPRGENKK